MRAGEKAFVALTWSGATAPATYEEADEAVNRTADFWRRWLSHGSFADHEWAPALQRSALTLKGLSYAPTGALLAAATTSLPETPGGERNWDYRYTWIRDSTFMLWGLYTLGFDWEANDFFCFVSDVASAATDLQIMYAVGGEPELKEETLDHLSGYEGARPVRVGNGAFDQRQHDVWGAVLDSVYLHTKSRDSMRESDWPLLMRLVEAALEHWREPDRGIWEVRGEPQHFTSSKMMCWVAANRGARLARLHGDEERAERWGAAADEMHADICEHGVDERGVFVQHYGTTALDASLLLLPLVRFLPANDERVRATVLAIADELTVDGLVLRYRVEETDDGLSGEEGTFAICSFWLVSALAEIGEHDRARSLCEKMLSFASPLGLYAEEIDPRSGRHLGNFPQAFTHLALINAVMHIIRADARDRRPSDEAAMSFFDYPGTGGQTATDEAAETFLPDATDADWAVLLRHCRRRHVAAGEAVIAAESTERSLVFVVDGTLDVLAPTAGRRTRLVSTVGPGSVLGEISFFDAAGRSALVKARTDGEVAELSHADFEALAREAPGLSRQILFDLGRTLARRLRTTTQRSI